MWKVSSYEAWALSCRVLMVRISTNEIKVQLNPIRSKLD